MPKPRAIWIRNSTSRHESSWENFNNLANSESLFHCRIPAKATLALDAGLCFFQLLDSCSLTIISGAGLRSCSLPATGTVCFLRLGTRFSSSVRDSLDKSLYDFGSSLKDLLGSSEQLTFLPGRVSVGRSLVLSSISTSGSTRFRNSLVERHRSSSFHSCLSILAPGTAQC